jgi:integrase
MERPLGRPVYAYWWEPGDPETETEADLKEIRGERSTCQYHLKKDMSSQMEEYAAELIRRYGLPEETLRPLAYGLVEAEMRGWEIAEQRTLGKEPLVFDAQARQPDPPNGASATSPMPAAPLASTLITPFGEWGRQSGGWRAGAESQAMVSLKLFIEVCGDRPADAYTRADGDTFRTTLRQLPNNYRKSHADHDKPLKQIIAEAAGKKARTLSDKTVKRHFWAVSRFFAFLMETGRLPHDADNPARGFSFNTKGTARQQRDMWDGDELRRLFASPVWTGCHPFFRSQPGAEIIRDTLFWLPLLGLFHGNRLEEFAQLRRSDVGQSDGVWFLNITDDDGRKLKNAQSRRRVPLHPELIRLGFLEYVAGMTKQPKDQIFPDLKPGGRDHKLGYGFSKKFSAYRKAIRLARRGLDYHSFRHGVTTKLYEVNVNEGWIDLLTGHEGGGESRRRYLKGVPLPQLRDAIARVTWPEIDLSRLYVREPADERWPVAATQTVAA